MPKTASLQDLVNAEKQLRGTTEASKPTQRRAPKATRAAPTVQTFLMVLTSKLTQQDEKDMARETKRGGRGNIYRLGLLFEAQEKVEKDVAKVLDRSDPEAMFELKRSLTTRFIPDFPPIRNVVRQIDSWVNDARHPSIIRK